MTPIMEPPCERRLTRREIRDRDPLAVSRETVWTYQQNRPSLLMKDFEKLGIPKKTTLRILLARGVCKWLAARRDIIKLKDQWLVDVRLAMTRLRDHKRRQHNQKDRASLMWWRGYLYAMSKCRQEVREICHSERWRVPDFDGPAWHEFKGLEDETNVSTRS